MIRHQYKDESIYRNAHKVAWHPILLDFNLWFQERYPYLIITSAYRKTGIHGTDPLRAEDLRSYVYLDPESIEHEINDIWVYDPDRPEKKVCIYHNVGRGNHFHIQVHPNTRKIGA